MVALKGIQINQFLDNPDKNIRAVLIYGPDHGLVKERVDKLIIDFIGSMDDPFNLSSIDDAKLKEDPEKLRDEAHAQSLMGGNRAVLISDAGEGLFKSIPTYLDLPNDECLIVARAGDLKPSSKIRGYFDKTKNVASIPCYNADKRSLNDLISAICEKNNLQIDPSAKKHLSELLGLDFAISKSEVEKLCLYCLGKESINIEDVNAVCGESGLINLDTLIDNLLTGNLTIFDQAYDKALLSGQPASSIILSVARHFQKLHTISLNMEAGLNSVEAIKRCSPPIHFKRKDSITLQAKIWKSIDVLSAQSDLQSCEKETRLKPALGNVITHRTLLKLGYIAKSRLNRR